MGAFYWAPIAVLLFLKFSPVQSQQFGGDFCTNNFAIYENKIIRTEDSKKLGAKYLTSKDLPTRRECLKLCCITHMCDVFIFEEKIPGTCYLFSCGPPDDFRCQFTSHANYTSAVLSKSQPARLEEEIRLNQHESELTRLREPMDNSMKEMDMIPSPSLSSSTTTSVSPPTLASVDLAISTHRTACKRFQFECHISKECIAIYNVCDGIPQCSDASDEAAELACPTQALRSTPSTTLQRDVQAHNEEVLPDMPLSLTPQPPSYARMLPPPQKLLSLEEQASQSQQQRLNPMIVHNQQSLQWPVNNQMQYNKELSGAYMDPSSGIVYRPNVNGLEYNMREGDTHGNYHGNSNGMMPLNNRLLTHKSNVANSNLQSPDYPSVDAGMLTNNNIQYKMNQNMAPYSFVPAYQNPGPMQHVNAVSGVNNMDVAAGHQMNYNMRPVEYYYDDTTHQQVQPLPPRANVALEHDVASMPAVQTSSSVKKQEDEVPPVAVASPTTTSTKHPPHRRKDKHVRKQQMSAEILIKESVAEQFESFYPSSAIIVFTCGLFLTVTLVILLCCRLKMIRRRLRKGGKSAYAHDADFLVNGMYL